MIDANQHKEELRQKVVSASESSSENERYEVWEKDAEEPIEEDQKIMPSFENMLRYVSFPQCWTRRKSIRFSEVLYNPCIIQNHLQDLADDFTHNYMLKYRPMSEIDAAYRVAMLEEASRYRKNSPFAL